jgi:hypothetical protein
MTAEHSEKHGTVPLCPTADLRSAVRTAAYMLEEEEAMKSIEGDEAPQIL